MLVSRSSTHAHTGGPRPPDMLLSGKGRFPGVRPQDVVQLLEKPGCKVACETVSEEGTEVEEGLGHREQSKGSGFRAVLGLGFRLAFTDHGCLGFRMRGFCFGDLAFEVL